MTHWNHRDCRLCTNGLSFITTHSVFFTVKQSATQIAHCNLEEYSTPALHSKSMNLQAE